MKYFLIFFLVTIFSHSIQAQSPQSFTLNVYGGYNFQDKVNFDAAYANVNDGFQYGGGLEYFVQRNQSIELKYLRHDTKFPLYIPGGVQVNKTNDKGALNYILLGGNYYFANSTQAKAIPFFSGSVGIGIIEGQNNSATKFAWDIKGGVKILASPSFSFKLQAYLQSIISTFGSDYWVTAGGAVVSVADYASIFQFGLGGAICFDFKKK